MGLRDIFRASKDVMDSFQKIMTDNEEVKKKLESAGGVISLIGIVVEIYSDIKERLKTPEEKAFGSLINVTFQSTEQLLNETKSKLPKDIQLKIDTKINRKEMVKTLLEPFLINSDWDSYLPDHPSIISFKYKILNILKESGCNNDLLNSFIIKFNINLEYNIDKDENIHIFYDWWTKEDKYNKLKDYLEFVKSHRYYIIGLDRRPLYEYYVDHNALLTSIYSWTYSDKEFYKYDVRNIKNIVADFLEKDKKWYMIVGAPFGIGKSSMARMIASDYASTYLNSEKDDLIDKNNSFIPILVFLKNGLDSVYSQDNLNYVLDDIVCPDEQSRKRKIFLILDGLDEYPYQNQISNLMDTLSGELRQKYPNLKVLITTRLDSELPEDLKINNVENEFVRLLPFTINQLDVFFEKYFTAGQSQSFYQKYGKEKITGNFILNELGFKNEKNGINEDVTKPLFAWMVSLTLANSDINIDFKKNWNNRMKKSLIYLIFIHNIIKGKYNPEDKSYFLEKKILRKISALYQIHGKDLTLDVIKNDLINDIIKTNPSFEIDRVLSTYLSFNKRKKDSLLTFVHQMFNDYLLAEFYLESILEDKSYRLNIGSPSKETTEFLKGLLEIFMVDDKDIIERYIGWNEKNQISLLNSFNYEKGLEIAKDDLISSTLKSINNANIVFLNANAVIKEVIWREVEITMPNYKDLWMHRWISLYILNTLSPDTCSEKIDQESLINLIKNSSINIPTYLKSFRNVNLFDSNLAGCNLSYADLTNANLAGANLFNANLSYADLTNANLAGANLFNANLFNANLTETNLAGSNLIMINLSSANLSHANLSRATINYANLISANLSHANLSRATINYANLISANLSCTNLSQANLSHARLTYSILINCQEYHNMICDYADLKNSAIDSKDIEIYLKKGNAANVPETITNIDSLKMNLRYRDLDEKTIGEILTLSLLKNL